MLHFGQGQAMLEGKCFKAYFLHYTPLYKKKRKKINWLAKYIFFCIKEKEKRKGNFLCSTCNTKILVIYSLLWAMMMRREISARVILYAILLGRINQHAPWGMQFRSSRKVMDEDRYNLYTVSSLVSVRVLMVCSISGRRYARE